jgi:hypothetical protein
LKYKLKLTTHVNLISLSILNVLKALFLDTKMLTEHSYPNYVPENPGNLVRDFTFKPLCQGKRGNRAHSKRGLLSARTSQNGVRKTKNPILPGNESDLFTCSKSF